MLEDFFTMLASGAEPGGSLTSIDKSVKSHLMSLASEKSRLNGGMSVSIEDFARESMMKR